MAHGDRDRTAESPDGVAAGTETGQLTQVTRAISAIYKEQFGRGPQHAYAQHCGPDAIVCFLEGTLTPVERRLAADGGSERVRETRLWFQSNVETTLRGVVEDIFDRKVLALVSGLDVVSDVSIETFVLEPK